MNNRKSPGYLKVRKQLTRPTSTRVAYLIPTLVNAHSLFTQMECSFALTGKGYVIIAADTTAARSIVKMKVDEDKIKTLSPHLLMAYSGEPGLRIPLFFLEVSSLMYGPRRYDPVCRIY